MIRYSLCCPSDHQFEAWFAGSEAFEAQSAAGQVHCPVCGSAEVAKMLMTPSVSTARKKQELARLPVPEQTAAQPPAETPPAMPVIAHPELPDSVKAMIRTVRDHVLKNADNVGAQFAEEARKIHYGEADERGIYGQASAEEVETLHEEGIDVMPLPVLPEDRN